MAIFNRRIKTFINKRKFIFEKIGRENFQKTKNIWFHAASLGEYEIALTLIKKIKKDKTNKIILTFFSESGFKLKKRAKEIDHTYYLPLDTKNKAKRFINTINPTTVIFIKSEIWPNYLNELSKKGVKTYLIEGKFRIGDWYFNAPLKKIIESRLKGFKKIFVQDNISEKVLKEKKLNNVVLAGSLKIERVKMQLKENNDNVKIEKFKKEEFCIVCGSTWQEDEKMIIKYINENNDTNIKWIIAPHDISEKNINRIKNKIKYKSIIYSDIVKSNVQYNVLIIDTIGDLKKIYKYADISYVGGGMGNLGLHNILEPCIFGNPVIIGKNFDKFIEARDLVRLKGVKSVINYEEFKFNLNKLINQKQKRDNMKKIISKYIKSKTGALSLILKEIKL